VRAGNRIRFRLIEMRIAAPGALPLNVARTNHARTNHITGFAGRRIGAQFGGSNWCAWNPSIEVMDRFQFCD
jgi:hypothetical protein